MRLAHVALLVGAAMLGGASTAEAARHAAPGGTGTACTQSAPCALSEAVRKAKAGDEVIVGAGTYQVAAQIVPESSDIDVHGEFSGPMPRIVGEVLNGAPPVLVPAGGGRLSYLEITQAGTNALAAFCNPGGTIERVRLRATGAGVDALTLRQECLVRDSVVIAEGPGSIAIHTYAYLPTTTSTLLVRNVTALASGPESVGIDAEYTEFMNPSSYTLDVRNSIVAGEAADLAARVGLGGPGNIEVSNSNFDLAVEEGAATVTGGSNQTAPPVFVDPAASDYREAAGSPTIDAGAADQIGTLDPDGNPRVVGAAPDIGAYEFVPAPTSGGIAAELESLAVSPAVLRARRRGPAVVSRKRAPVGTTVSYRLSAAGSVRFAVERKAAGRRAGGKCVKRTRANRKRKRCALYRKLRGSFSHPGEAGANRFRFSGRMGGRALAPGRYRLIGALGASSRRAGFRIVR